jgi:uncharacterized protein YndB with AHSA1/START domain
MNNEINNTRIIAASLEKVYHSFADPQLLAQWWGPEGFTNTIHVFDLRVGGKWELTMHGPDKGNYENASIFTRIEPMQLIAWQRISQPWFDMEVRFEKITETTTRISFRMIFESEEACDKIRRFAQPKNEENFDRLERLLGSTTI